MSRDKTSKLDLNNALIILYFIAPLGNNDPSLARVYYSARDLKENLHISIDNNKFYNSVLNWIQL